MTLKPHDLVVVARLLAPGADALSYAALARDAGLSKSETHEAVVRARAARLLQADRLVVEYAALEAFLLHGVRFAYSGSIGSKPTEGVALDLSWAPASAPRYVWPRAGAPDRRIGVDPLFKGCADLATDPHMRLWLSAIEVLRLHDAAERPHAARLVRDRLTARASLDADPPPKLTSMQPIEKDKAAIVAAAEQAVLRRGFERASTDDIAAAAGTDAAAVRAVFPDQSVLQRVIFERVASGALQFLGPIFTYGADVGPTRLAECLAGFLGYCDGNERFYRILAWTHAEHHLGFNASISEASSFMVDRLTASVAAASGTNDRIDALARTHLFLCFPDLYNVIRWNYLERLDERFDRLAIAARTRQLIETTLLDATLTAK